MRKQGAAKRIALFHVAVLIHLGVVAGPAAGGGWRLPTAGAVPVAVATETPHAAVPPESPRPPASSRTAGTSQRAPGEEIFFDAESLWSAGDLTGALRRFDEVVERYPAEQYPQLTWRAAARIRAAEIRLRLGRVEAAAASFLAALDDEPASPWTARARLGLATTFLHRGRWREAADLLQRIIDTAETGGADADPGTSIVAAQYLGLVHRLRVRPEAGRLPWQASRAVSLPPGTLDDPIGVAASATGLLLIADEGSDLVALVGTEGNIRTLPEPDVRLPWWDGDGIGYVATKTGTLMPQRNERLQFASPGRPGRSLENVKVGVRGSNGDWLLLDERDRRVLRYGADGAYRGELPIGARARPVDLARDALGWVHVLDAETNSVLRFGPEGGPDGGITVPDWRRPTAIDIDLTGNLYVLDRDSKRIHVLGAEGATLWTLGPTLPGGVELRDPRDVAVDGSGHLYVADRGMGAVLEVR